MQYYLGDQTKGQSPMRRLNIHSNVTGRQVSYSASPPEPPSAGHTQRSPPILNSTSLLPPLLLLLPLHQHLFHIFSHSSLIVRVGRTLKLASYHSQVLSDEIQVDNCGCACSRPIGGESWRPTMYFCTSLLLCLMISVNSPKW